MILLITLERLKNICVQWEDAVIEKEYLDTKKVFENARSH